MGALLVFLYYSISSFFKRISHHLIWHLILIKSGKKREGRKRSRSMSGFESMFWKWNHEDRVYGWGVSLRWDGESVWIIHLLAQSNYSLYIGRCLLLVISGDLFLGTEGERVWVKLPAMGNLRPKVDFMNLYRTYICWNISINHKKHHVLLQIFVCYHLFYIVLAILCTTVAITWHWLLHCRYKTKGQGSESSWGMNLQCINSIPVYMSTVNSVCVPSHRRIVSVYW